MLIFVVKTCSFYSSCLLIYAIARDYSFVFVAGSVSESYPFVAAVLNFYLLSACVVPAGAGRTVTEGFSVVVLKAVDPLCNYSTPAVDPLTFIVGTFRTVVEFPNVDEFAIVVELFIEFIIVSPPLIPFVSALFAANNFYRSMYTNGFVARSMMTRLYSWKLQISKSGRGIF